MAGRLSSLSVGARLALFGTAAAVAGVVLAGLRVAEALALVRAAHRQAAGTEYVEALSHLFQRVAEHRGLAARLLSGEDVSAELAAKQQEAQAAFQAAAEVNRRQGALLGTGRALEELRASWLRIVEGLGAMTPEESFLRHTRLIADLLELVRQVAETSGIVHDSFPEVALLSDVVVGALPRAIEAMGQLRALGSRTLVRGSATVEERAGVQERVGAVRLLQAEFGRRLQQVLARSPARGSLEEKLRQGDQLTERYLALAEGAVVRAERLAVPASEYFAAATRAIDARFDLYREATGVLRETVVRRATRIQRGAWTVAGLLVVLLTAAAVGGVVIARSVTGPLARLVHALERLEEGDLHVEVGLRGQDEVAYLAQTFDRVTARLRLATRQQELLRSPSFCKAARDSRCT